MPGTASDPNSVGQTAIGQTAVGQTGPPATASAISAGTASVRVGTGIGVWVRDLIISLAISAFVIIFLYQPVKVEGVSMMPSLEDQERIFVNKFVYRLEPIERGDRIRIDGGQVYVNDEALGEDYVPPAYTDSRSYPETAVPEHCFFVLGDHRSMSSDSREFGPVNQSLIYGKAVFGYWPMDKLGRVR
jgi:signal peptidase I